MNTSVEQVSAQLGEVVVTGTKPPIYNSEKNGSSINISNVQMGVIPTVSRSINDVTRLTPQANGNTIGGGNYRQNFILVDGAQFNNAFGIGTNLPGNGSPISLDALDQSDAFFAYVDQDKYLSTRKGQYAERNGALYPWVNKFDLKLQQDFFIKVAGKRNIIQVTFDILNVGNLLNKKWGNVWSYKQNNILVMTNNNAVTAGGTTVPTFRLNPYNNTMIDKTFTPALNYGSTYSMQIGFRYIFN